MRRFFTPLSLVNLIAVIGFAQETGKQNLSTKLDALTEKVAEIEARLESVYTTLEGVIGGHSNRLKEVEAGISALRQELYEVKLGMGKEGVSPVKEPLEQSSVSARIAVAEEKIRTLESKVKETEKEERQLLLTPIFEFRLRSEYKRSKDDLNSDIDDNDSFFLQRLSLGFSIQPVEWLKGTVVIRDSRVWGQEKDVQNNEKNLDLHEGYVLMKNKLVDGLWIKLGRMELNYGNEFQVGRGNWSNVGRAFDGLLVSYGLKANGSTKEYFRADVFSTKVKEGQANLSEGYDESFHGLYFTSNYLWFMKAIEAYFLYLNIDLEEKDENNKWHKKDEDIATLGIRVNVTPFKQTYLKGLSFEGEAAVQFGNKWEDIKLKHFAAMYFVRLLYEIPVWGKPTIGGFYYWTSGDANPDDDISNAYIPLFPTLHRVLGNMDLFTLQGVWDIGGTVRFSPHANIFMKIDYHRFFLSSDGGKIKAFDGKADFQPGKERYLGQEIDFDVSWNAWKYLKLDAGYAVFLPSSTVDGLKVKRNSQEVILGGDMAHWFYFTSTVSF